MLAVLNVVGLTTSLLPHAPRITALASRGGRIRRLIPVLPAVTSTAQATMLTGRAPDGHGIVGNGWYDRESAEVRFWRQSNRLVQGPKVWDDIRAMHPAFTCAQLFWWFNMHAAVDIAVTPRPMYLADGRKIPDIHTRPPELRDDLQDALGRFPLFSFWGPGANIESSKWIAACAQRTVERHRPGLTLVYLPHLDYPLQKLGPDDPSIPREVEAIDRVVGELAESLRSRGVRTIIVSEYGIEKVTAPVRINRFLRQRRLLAVRVERGRDHLDPGESRAFAVVDHQIAHVYVDDPARREQVAAMLADLDGVEEVLAGASRRERGLDHERSGDIVLVAAAGRWFSYDWWLDDAAAPDFARTVDIHRKPGYDPLELFIDPRLRFPRLAIAHRLLRRKLGFRTLLDVIPLDPALVRGSHGRDQVPEALRPLIITPDDPGGPDEIPAAQVRDEIVRAFA